MTRALARFVDAADVSTWTGLPTDAATALGIDVGEVLVVDGLLGEPPSSTSWTALATHRFTDGLRAWLDDERVILIEGHMPAGDDGELLGIPELGRPDAALDLVFGPLTIASGELVYASRGLAVCVNPRSRVLLAIRGFAPTTLEEYLHRLRAVPEPELRLAGRGTP